MTWLTVMEYLCHKWPRICSNCRKHFPVLSSSWLITGFITRLTRRLPLVEQELLTLPEHLCSPPVFSGVRVCVCFVDRVNCVVCPSMYGFWLPLWYLQTLLGQAVSEEKNFRNWSTRNKKFLWRPCMLTDRDDMSNLYVGSSIDFFDVIIFYGFIVLFGEQKLNLFYNLILERSRTTISLYNLIIISLKINLFYLLGMI